MRDTTSLENDETLTKKATARGVPIPHTIVDRVAETFPGRWQASTIDLCKRVDGIFAPDIYFDDVVELLDGMDSQRGDGPNRRIRRRPMPKNVIEFGPHYWARQQKAAAR